MQCQRCSRKEGEYLCSVCERIVCADCKVISTGRVFCLDHSPLKASGKEAAQEKPRPNFKTAKDIAYASFILLLGVVGIFFVTTKFIVGMIETNIDAITGNMPQLGFLFDLMTYFNNFALYLIILLIIILISCIVYIAVKKRQYKNI